VAQGAAGGGGRLGTRPGQWVPLSTEFFGDDRILDLSPVACFAFLASMLVARKVGRDGEFTLAQVRRECHYVHDIDAAATELYDVGLWEETDGRRARVANWLRWNRSSAESRDLSRVRSAAGRQGGLKSGASRAKTAANRAGTDAGTGANQTGGKREASCFDSGPADEAKIEAKRSNGRFASPRNARSDGESKQKGTRVREERRELEKQLARSAPSTEVKSSRAAPTAPRRRTPVFEALLAEAGIAPGTTLTANERGRFNAAGKQLREVGASAAEIRRRAGLYRERHPTWELTATALATHWSALGASGPVNGDAPAANFAPRLAPGEHS
jgi:hypothetical protein